MVTDAKVHSSEHVLHDFFFFKRLLLSTALSARAFTL